LAPQYSGSKDESENYVGGIYLCQKKLGSGGFGEVWSCADVTAASKNDAIDGRKSVEVPATYAMKIENLLEPSEKEKKNGITKK